VLHESVIFDIVIRTNNLTDVIDPIRDRPIGDVGSGCKLIVNSGEDAIVIDKSVDKAIVI